MGVVTGKGGGRADLGGRRSTKWVRRSSGITFSLFPDIRQAQRLPSECLLGCCEGCCRAASLLREHTPHFLGWESKVCGLEKDLIPRTKREGGYSRWRLPNESHYNYQGERAPSSWRCRGHPSESLRGQETQWGNAEGKPTSLTFSQWWQFLSHWKSWSLIFHRSERVEIVWSEAIPLDWFFPLHLTGVPEARVGDGAGEEGRPKVKGWWPAPRVKQSVEPSVG